MTIVDDRLYEVRVLYGYDSVFNPKDIRWYYKEQQIIEYIHRRSKELDGIVNFTIEEVSEDTLSIISSQIGQTT